MKLFPHILMYPQGVSIQLVSETDIEFAVLEDLWKKGELKTGNGASDAGGGFKKGFYISYPEESSNTRPNQD